MAPVVTTTSGDVRGATDNGVHRFLGIPYAAPPLGELRFLAPARPAPWTGVRDAVDYGPTAPQPGQGVTLIPEPVVPGDDFLNLNVFTPELGADARLPVFVWIHGGGFVNGCNRSPWYDGRSFARDGVVTVAINYRLGIEGFLPIEGAPANRGVLDWIAALGWVQENVAAFGGDPANVTIGGQSAGGMACTTLLTVPRAAGLFRRAMAISGAASNVGELADSARIVQKYAEALGIERVTRDAFASLSPERLLEVQQGLSPMGGRADNDIVARFRGMAKRTTGLAPLVDGDLIPRQPLEAIREGVAGDLELVCGATAEEMDGLLRGLGDSVDNSTAVEALGALGMGTVACTTYVAAAGDIPAARILGKAMTDSAFRVPAVRLAEARVAGGGRAPTFLYDFAWRGRLGACHCVDVPFGWDVLDAEHVAFTLGDNPPPPQPLADDVHSAWVGFITKGEAGWPAYDASDRPTMVFGTPSQVVNDRHAVERHAFEGVR